MTKIVKITRSDKQFRITIPQEIVSLKGWDEDTEILFIPLMSDTSKELTKDTAILLKEAKKEGRRK